MTDDSFRRMPSPWLGNEAYDELNETFYATEPHDYFARRLELLVLAAARPDVVARELADGLEYGGLSYAADRGHHERPDEFIVSEAVTISHHVAETLLRQFLAHEELSRCPWIAIAELRNHSAFKKKLRARFKGEPLSNERRSRLARVFYGHSNPTADGLTRQDWNDSLDDLERWLTYFAITVLEESHLYNSLKHGLTVSPGAEHFSIGSPDDGAPIMQSDGLSIAFLTLKSKGGWPNLWHRRTHWRRPETLIAESWLANRLLESVWRIGRAVRVDGGDLGGTITYFQPCFDELMRSRREHSSRITTLERDAGYHFAHTLPLACSSCGRKAKAREHQSAWWGRRDEGAAVLTPVCPRCRAEVEPSA